MFKNHTIFLLLLWICMVWLGLFRTVYGTRLPLEIYEFTPSDFASDITELKHKALMYSTIDQKLADANSSENEESNIKGNTEALYIGKKPLSRSTKFHSTSEPIKHLTFPLMSSSLPPTRKSIVHKTDHYNFNGNGNHNYDNHNINVTEYTNAKDNRKSRQMLNIHSVDHYFTSFNIDVNQAAISDTDNNTFSINEIIARDLDKSGAAYITPSSSSSQLSSSSSSTIQKFHANLYHNNNSKNAVRILYQVGNSEDDLPACAPYAVCSKIDLYGTPWLERQCRCPPITNDVSEIQNKHHLHYNSHAHQNPYYHHNQRTFMHPHYHHYKYHQDQITRAFNNNINNNYQYYFKHLNHHRPMKQNVHLKRHIEDADINGNYDRQFSETLHFRQLMYEHTNEQIYENAYDTYRSNKGKIMIIPAHSTHGNSTLTNSKMVEPVLQNNLHEHINSANPDRFVGVDNIMRRLHPSLSLLYLKNPEDLETNVHQQQRTKPRSNNKNGCPRGLGIDDGHTVVDKTRHYKLCQPVYELPMCRHFRDYTWTLTTSAKMNSTEQIVHCRCPKGSVTYLTKREPLDNNDIGYRYLFACSPITRIRCQRKQPCKLFTVRKRQEFIDEVNINFLCQCPKGHHCPTHHTQPGILAGETFLDDNIQTYSGYCMTND